MIIVLLLSPDLHSKLNEFKALKIIQVLKFFILQPQPGQIVTIMTLAEHDRWFGLPV